MQMAGSGLGPGHMSPARAPAFILSGVWGGKEGEPPQAASRDLSRWVRGERGPQGRGDAFLEADREGCSWGHPLLGQWKKWESGGWPRALSCWNPKVICRGDLPGIPQKPERHCVTPRHFLASAQWLCSPSWVPCKAVATLTPSFSGSQSPPAFPQVVPSAWSVFPFLDTSLALGLWP